MPFDIRTGVSAMASYESLGSRPRSVLDICISYTHHAGRPLLHIERRAGTADNHWLGWIAGWSDPVLCHDLAGSQHELTCRYGAYTAKKTAGIGESVGQSSDSFAEFCARRTDAGFWPGPPVRRTGTFDPEPPMALAIPVIQQVRSRHSTCYGLAEPARRGPDSAYPDQLR